MMNMNEAKMLTPSERLQAMEVLWDTICHDEIPLEPPIWHKKILADRERILASGDAEFVTMEELKAIRR
jgi:hypothetical protein